MTRDPVLSRVSDALDLFNAGRRAEARDAFFAIWGDIQGGDDFHCCILAHFMADTQDDPLEELKWDQRALDAAGRLGKDNASSPEGSLSVLSLYPSLHLNLADVMHRTGDNAGARRQLALAQATIGALTDDSYGQMVRGGIARLAQALG